MKPPDAPLYVRSHDLARWIHERILGWDEDLRATLGLPLAKESRGLVLSVCLALTFIRARPQQAWEADQAVARLRELLRLARDLGALPASSHRYAQGELLQIGRMVGGWRKRWSLPEETVFDPEETGRGR